MHSSRARSRLPSPCALRRRTTGDTVPMLLRLWKTAAVAFMVCASLCGNAYAQTIFNQAHTVAAADRAVPVEHTFAISVAGTYQITLTDLGALLIPPAPLAAAKLS